jgi:nitroreductase
MAARAPSSYNLQPWNLIVLTGAEEKERLRKVAMNQAKVSEAPIACIVLADADGWREGHPTMERNFREMVAAGGIKPERHDWYAGACRKMYGGGRDYSLAFAAKNAAFFAMSLMYACAHLGLDTHPMDGFDLDGVREAFHIPDNYWIPLLLAVGRLRPGESAPAPKWRKGWDDIVVRFDGDPS